MRTGRTRSLTRTTAPAVDPDPDPNPDPDPRADRDNQSDARVTRSISNPRARRICFGSSRTTRTACIIASIALRV